MEIEELWDTSDKNMPQYEIQLQRVDADGELFWRFRAKDTSDNYGESIIDVGRKQLKDLHDAIEQELYPERYFRNKVDAISRMVWETKPKTCPFCDAELKPSRFALTGAFTDFCPQLHGKLYQVENVDKKCYQWYNLVRYP